jgi:hypothetical protein
VARGNQPLTTGAPPMVRLDRIIVMKAGLHNGEDWDHIVERKHEEELAAGVVYWGYGGSVCHPLTQVQPFADGSPVTVLMVHTDSDFIGDPTFADAASRDGRSWEPIPAGVATSGKYALVMRSFRRVDLRVDLGAYEVAVGQKEGKPLPSYFRFRVDKACARLAPSDRLSDHRNVVDVVVQADLVEPYAVILRTPTFSRYPPGSA